MSEHPGRWAFWERVRRQLVGAVALVLLVAAMLFGIIRVGRWSVDRLAGEDRFQVAFESIECEAPPGMSRADFLAEVRYLSRLPARVPTMGDQARDTIVAAFRKHPRVLSVDDVRSEAAGRLRVVLTMRRPALAVEWQKTVRVVDDRGVLLPASASADGLPRFVGQPSPPGSEGEPWPDAEVVRQARR